MLEWTPNKFLNLSDDISLITSFYYNQPDINNYARSFAQGMMFSQVNYTRYNSTISDNFYWSGQDKFFVTASNSSCPRNQFLKGLTNRRVNFDGWGQGDGPIYGASNFACSSFRNANASTCVKVSSPTQLPFFQGTSN
jgi:hypothetical protein